MEVGLLYGALGQVGLLYGRQARSAYYMGARPGRLIIWVLGQVGLLYGR